MRSHTLDKKKEIYLYQFTWHNTKQNKNIKRNTDLVSDWQGAPENSFMGYRVKMLLVIRQQTKVGELINGIRL